MKAMSEGLSAHDREWLTHFRARNGIENPVSREEAGGEAEVESAEMADWKAYMAVRYANGSSHRLRRSATQIRADFLEKMGQVQRFKQGPLVILLMIALMKKEEDDEC